MRAFLYFLDKRGNLFALLVAFLYNMRRVGVLA